jgi:uncharacterized protein
MNLRKIVLLSLTLCTSVTLLGMETSTCDIPKSQAEPELLTFTLEEQPYTFLLEPILKHITRYQKGIDSIGQDKLLGFHHYKPTSTKELSAGITLSIVQDNLWVLALGDVTKFHKGYVIYQGKAFPKTFFPTSWDKDGIGTYVTYLLTSGKRAVKIKNHPAGLTKTYGVTLTDSNGQALYCIIHGCPLIPQSMRLVTLYPVCSAQPELEHLSLTLKTLAYEQMQKLQVAAKTHTSNPELIVALGRKDSERVQQLLSLDADANVYDSKGKSALMYAATAGDWSLVSALLEHDADALRQDNDGNTAFHYALESGDYFTALGLINPNLIDKANKQSTTPLGIALKNKNIEALELLLQFKANIILLDTFGRSPLMLAVKAYQGKADLAFCKIALTLLLQAGTDVNAQDKAGNTALHYAVESNSKELVQLLINAHACLSTPNTKNETALMLAKKLNYTSIATLFESIEKEKHEWLQESKGTELMYAVKSENISETKKLLAQGVKVNTQDSYCWTALVYAVEKGNSELVTLLLDTGANPCIKLSSGHSVLSYAQSQESAPIIEALEKKIAELETPALENKKKEQEYLKACLTRFKDDLDKGELSEETLSALPVFKNKILNAKSGITPLLYAVKEKKHRVIQQLLKHGADITAVDSQKQDALALAYAQSDLKALKILLEHSTHSRITELLIQALTENNSEVSKFLCTQVNGLAYQALTKALRDSNPALVSKLVTQQLTPTEAGQAFIIALEKGNSDAARLIIKTCPQVVSYKDSKGMTPLMHSAYHNFLELVQLLVETGADIHALDNDNKRARDYTSSKNPIYHYLLAQEQSFEQAKKQAQDKVAKELRKQELQQQGCPDLAILVSIGDSAAVEKYQGDNVNAGTFEGSTPLLIAAKNNNEKLISLLLAKSGINVNARDKDGYTALMYAALNENNPMVLMLIQHGAHPCVCNNQKATALDLIKSKKNGSLLIISSLQEAQRKILTAYLSRIRQLDKNIFKELQANLALPIVFPTCYLTPELVINLITLGYQYHSQIPEEDKFNTIDLLRKIVDNPQVLKNTLDNALVLISKHESRGGVDDIVMAKLLLNAGANVNAKNSDDVTALMPASGQGKIALVKLLIDAHTNVNAQDKHNNTPLTDALRGGHTEIVKLLLAAGASVNKEDKWGKVPLHWAVAWGKKDIVELLLKSGADVNRADNDGETPLHLAVDKGYSEIVQLLFHAGANVNVRGKHGYTPLYWASNRGNSDIVKLLLSFGADVTIPDEFSMTALMSATIEHKGNPIQHLLEAGADVNAQDDEGNTALHYAAHLDDKDIVALLLNAGANVNVKNEDNITPLTWAIEQGRIDSVQLLIKACADVNARNSLDQTPLMYTANKGHTDIAKFLLKAGAKVNAQDKRGNTPLMEASTCGHTEMVKLLIAIGAHVNIKNKNGVEALFYAVEKESIEIIKLLLQAGAAVNTQDNQGVTPLMYACMQENIEIVKLLVEAGADLNTIKDKHGKTALTYAEQTRNTDIVQILLFSKQSYEHYQKNKSMIMQP